MNSAHNIYIHVPFCASKCRYCAFYSAPNAHPDWAAYTNGICHEIDIWAEKLGPVTIPTVFFGGGTPSLMPPSYMAKIITHLGHRFHIHPDTEITIEANPRTLTPGALHEFVQMGINRLSIGVQSFIDTELEFMGRCHNATDARRLIDMALDMRLNTSADFIYGMPGHTTDHIINLCQEINRIGLNHCSLYELTIEPATPFGKMNLDMPNNDIMADMYQAIASTLSLPRYEVSNYATPGHECRHNTNIWDGAPYIGLGRGGAGRPYINGTWYEQSGGPTLTQTPITNATRAIEKIMTGMRTIRGVTLTDDVRDAINPNGVATALANGDIHITPENRMAPTTKGILILDNLLINLIR